MYSIFLGLAVSLLIFIHSEILRKSLWAFSSRLSRLLDVMVTCVPSPYMLAIDNSKHVSNHSDRL